MNERALDLELHRLVDALAHDPVYFRCNGTGDLEWQLSLYEKRLRFLVDEFGFRFKDRRRRVLAGEFDVVAMEYIGRHADLALIVLDRDCVLQLHIQVGRRRWLRRRGTEVEAIHACLTGQEDIVPDAEAISAGRDEARRLFILRITDFLRNELRPCLMEGDRGPLERAAQYLRMRREIWGDPAWQAQEEAEQEARLNAAIERRTGIPAAGLSADPAMRHPHSAGRARWSATAVLGPLSGAAVFMLVAALFRLLTAVVLGIHPRDWLPLICSWAGFVILLILALIGVRHADRIERLPFTLWAAMVAAASAAATGALAWMTSTV